MVKNFDWKIKAFDITGVWLEIDFHIKMCLVFFFYVELLNTMEM